MLFGSYARGDVSEQSDVDVLALSQSPRRPRRAGRVNLSYYDRPTLSGMAEHGSLFVLHLRIDGLILRDPDNLLRDCLQRYRQPSNYNGLRNHLRSVANFLDVGAEAYLTRWQAYNELALFLLRTTLYAEFAEAGKPMFSLSAIERVISRDDLSLALTIKNGTGASWRPFVAAKKLIEEKLGSTVRNEHGSIEALMTNVGYADPAVIGFGLKLLGREDPTLGYHFWTPSA